MKHAYLIMAHNDFEVLEKLLISIDDIRNDIYIHIDKKVKNFDFEKYRRIVNFSNLYFIKRRVVTWGGDSLIKCELDLIETAVKNNQYRYFHLLSGVDFPLKNQDYIHEFFMINDGKNFLDIDPNYKINKYEENRIKLYRFCQNYIGRDATILIYFENLFLKVQNLLNIERYKDLNIELFKGANWFSITNDLVELILTNKKFIKKYFYFSYCADEMFMQTIAYNDEKMLNTLENNSLRYIDWKRGGPYTFGEEDFELLIHSDKLFARKITSKNLLLNMLNNFINNGM